MKLPNEFVLEQNYVNPFNPTTQISIAIPQSSNVVLKIYNMLAVKLKLLLVKLKMQAAKLFPGTAIINLIRKYQTHLPLQTIGW